MKNNGDCEERMEASYLQIKLKPISKDEVVDFHQALTLVDTVESFSKHYSHSCCVGYASHFEPVRKDARRDLEHKPGSYHFHCKACDVVWRSKYSVDEYGNQTLPPVCEQCGRSLFVEKTQ